MPRATTEEQLACVRLFLMGKSYQEIDRLVFGIDRYSGGVSWEVIPALMDRVHREIRRRGRGGTSTPNAPSASRADEEGGTLIVPKQQSKGSDE